MNLHSASETVAPHQPAVPVSNGTLAMWMFLTTEAMFFAALVGTWIVVRSTAGDAWPDQNMVHVNLLYGILNTVVLLASGVAAWFAARSAERKDAGRARHWMLVTILLGSAFLGIKGYEYFEKHELGLVNLGQPGLVHDRADAIYVSAVGATVKERLLHDSGLTADETGSLELIQQGLVAWTSSQAGRTSDPGYQQAVFDCLATLIFPVGDTATSAAFLVDEKSSLGSDLQGLLETRKRQEVKLAGLQQKMAAETSATAKDEATAITLELSGINLKIVRTEARIRALDRFAPGISSGSGGINVVEHLRLPVVVPGGRSWSSTWLLLTGMHALHMVAGLLAWLMILPIRNPALFSATVGNCARYWHFVDVVWIVIFLVVYCL